MKKYLLLLPFCVFITPIFAAKPFNQKFEDIITKSREELFSTYTKRVQAVATILYYMALAIYEGPQSEFRTKANSIANKISLLNGLPMEIDKGISEITNSDPEKQQELQIGALNSMYQQALRQLSKNERVIYGTATKLEPRLQ